MDRLANKYRIASARANWWDYGSNAAYFITICTQNRMHFFGEIVHREMMLTALGQYAQSCWNEIPNHFPFVQLGAFVVMPNHIHGIIIIDKTDGETQKKTGTQSVMGPQSIKTQNIASLQQTTPHVNKFGPQSQNLASIVRGYKIGVTKLSKISNPNFNWQPRFHDHIIRNDTEYQRINDYIENNPVNWSIDNFFDQE